MLIFAEGDILFFEGEPSSGLYVLFKGQVHLCKLGLHGQETIIARIGTCATPDSPSLGKVIFTEEKQRHYLIATENHLK